METRVVPPLGIAHAGVPPRRDRLLVHEAVEVGLALRLRVRIEDGRRRKEHRQVEVELGIPPGQRQFALPREVVADPSVERREVGVVVVELAAGVVAAAREVVVEAAIRALDVGLLLEGVVAPALEPDGPLWRPLPLLGDDVDHAADGVRAVERRLRTAHDLDPLDGVEAQFRQFGRPQGRTRHPHAVNEHGHLLRARAPDLDAGRLTEAARPLDLDAGHVAQRVLDSAVVVRADVVFRDDAHGRPQLALRRLDLRRGDDDGIDLLRLRLHLLGDGRGGYQCCHHQDHETSLHGSPPFPRKGFVALPRIGLLTRGSSRPSGLPIPRHAEQWLRCRIGRRSPLTVAGPCRLRLAPYRLP